MTKFERIIINFPPIAFIIKKSKAIIIPGFQGLPLYDVVLFFFQQINKIGLNQRAAAISFNFIMEFRQHVFSCLPLCLIFNWASSLM